MVKFGASFDEVWKMDNNCWSKSILLQKHLLRWDSENLKKMCLNSLIIHGVINAKVACFIHCFQNTRHVTSCDVSLSEFQNRYQDQIIRIYNISIQLIFRSIWSVFDEGVAIYWFSPISHIWASSGMLMTVFLWKMPGLVQKFHLFKILVIHTCSDNFSENQSWWRNLHYLP